MTPGLQAASDCVRMSLTHQATRELNLIPQQENNSLKAESSPPRARSYTSSHVTKANQSCWIFNDTFVKQLPSNIFSNCSGEKQKEHLCLCHPYLHKKLLDR